MTPKQRAKQWWNSLSALKQTEICDTNAEIVGPVRRRETLSNLEIYKLYILEIAKHVSFNVDSFDELNLEKKTEFLTLTGQMFLSDSNRKEIESQYRFLKTVVDERGLEKIILYL